jgi:kumamolisin
MPQSNDIAIPENYVRLEGSERHPSPSARLLGPADPNEHFDVTIVLRRRLDGETVPDFVYFKTPPSTRPRLSEEEFARKYGASDDDIREVTEFVYRNGLIVEETHAARRTLVVSGTAEQMSQAFGVKLGRAQSRAPSLAGSGNGNLSRPRRIHLCSSRLGGDHRWRLRAG